MLTTFRCNVNFIPFSGDYPPATNEYAETQPGIGSSLELHSWDDSFGLPKGRTQLAVAGRFLRSRTLLRARPALWRGFGASAPRSARRHQLPAGHFEGEAAALEGLDRVAPRLVEAQVSAPVEVRGRAFQAEEVVQHLGRA